MTWRYALLKKDGVYRVCESYNLETHKGYTGEIAPLGETPEELLEDLKRMLEDVNEDVANGNIIEWKEEERE